MQGSSWTEERVKERGFPPKSHKIKIPGEGSINHRCLFAFILSPARPAMESTFTWCWLRTFCLVTKKPRDSTNRHYLLIDRLIITFIN